MIYLDSSALLKLVWTESESDALLRWLADQSEESVTSSELARVEVFRAARRYDDSAVAQARAMIGDLAVIALNRAVQDIAMEIGDPLLRTLDALHLASAFRLGGELSAFVAYDHRLRTAAESAGLPVCAPGQT